MKITVTQSIINVVLDYELEGTVKVYIDSLKNGKNKLSPNDEDHDYVLEAEAYGSEGFYIYAPENFDLKSFTMLVNDSDLGFYYDELDLYYRQIQDLANNCNTCLDKEQKENIVLLSTRKSLLEYAMEEGSVEDSISLYSDMMRMLNKNCMSGTGNICLPKGPTIIGGGCKDGVCSIC